MRFNLIVVGTLIMALVIGLSGGDIQVTSEQRWGGPDQGIVIDREPADTDGVVVIDCNYSNGNDGC